VDIGFAFGFITFGSEHTNVTVVSNRFLVGFQFMTVELAYRSIPVSEIYRYSSREAPYALSAEGSI